MWFLSLRCTDRLRFLLSPFREQPYLVALTCVVYLITLVWSDSKFVRQSVLSGRQALERLAPFDPIPRFAEGFFEVRIDADFEPHYIPFLPRRCIAALLKKLEEQKPTAIVVLASFPQRCILDCKSDSLSAYLGERDNDSVPIYFQTLVRDDRSDSQKAEGLGPILVKTVSSSDSWNDMSAVRSAPILATPTGIYPFALKGHSDKSFHPLLTLPVQIAADLGLAKEIREALYKRAEIAARNCEREPGTCTWALGTALEESLGVAGWTAPNGVVVPPAMAVAPLAVPFVRASRLVGVDDDVQCSEWSLTENNVQGSGELEGKTVVVTNPSLNDSSDPLAQRIGTAVAAIATAQTLDCVPIWVRQIGVILGLVALICTHVWFPKSAELGILLLSSGTAIGLYMVMPCLTVGLAHMGLAMGIVAVAKRSTDLFIGTCDICTMVWRWVR